MLDKILSNGLKIAGILALIFIIYLMAIVFMISEDIIALIRKFI